MFTPIYGDITPDFLASPDDICLVGFFPQELASQDAGKHRADTLVSSCATAARLGHGKVVLYYAYDTDPREVYDIPEVVSHVQYLFAACPHLMYFLCSDLEAMRPILLCLYGATVIGVSGGTAQVGIPDIDRARKTSRDLQSAVNAYAASIGDRIGGTETVNVIRSLGV